MSVDFATVVKSPVEIHVVPVDDICDHEMDDRCVCGPSQEMVWDFDKGQYDGSIIVHPSLDGREIGD